MSQYTKLYQNKQWQALRLSQLQREPLCAMCLKRNRITEATVCDHIEPHNGNLKAFWSGPFQSLCAQCHSSDKQRMENGKEPKAVIGRDGWPI